jgi:plastocyanin
MFAIERSLRIAACIGFLAVTGCGGAGASRGAAPASFATYSISGTVIGATGVAPGVAMTLGGTATAFATTDTSGNFTFRNLLNGSYTVTPSGTGSTFSPASLAVVVSGGDVVGQDFIASAAAIAFSVSGTVSGPAAAGVAIALGGDNTGSTIADTGGNYAFKRLVNGNYTVTPSGTGLTFSPASLAFTIRGANVAGQDFTATGGTTAFLISIQGYAFSPVNLAVPPGATVTVQNLDGGSGLAHSVTSETTLDAFTPGGVNGVQFDTGLFTTGTPTFTIPSTAPSGTVVYYYCRNHRSMMHSSGGFGVNASQASITVQPGAAPNGSPGGGATGGGGTPMPPSGGY